jgi:hypothetical protein
MQAQEVSPPPPPDLRVPVAPPVQEIPIRPLVVKLPPERIVERTIVEREPRTEPLPVAPISIQVPPAAAPHITVNVPPERNLHEPNERVRTKDVPIDDTPYSEAERAPDATSEVPPVAEVPHTLPPVEVGSSAQPEVKKPEERGSSPSPEPETSTSAQSEPPTEEKTSQRKKKVPREVPPSADTGSSGDKMKVYSGKGRRHTDDEIDDILDEYLQYGNLPQYVTERQRRDYRKHKRLDVRRLYLERAGLIKTL